MHFPEDEIIPRDLHFNISQHAERHWFDGDLMKTAVMDCFSVLLPEGERFFIRSLKHYAEASGDPELKREIMGYAAQEAYHTREHEDYNASLRALGYDVDVMEERGKRLLDAVRNPLYRLVGTCALEHLTTTFAKTTLKHPHVLDGSAQPYRQVWTWHALEELEHQAVALNVLRSATSGMPAWRRYLLRVTGLSLAVAGLAVVMFRNIMTYARNDGMKIGPRFWMRLFSAMFHHPGYIRYSAGSFFRYYLPWFDPNDRHDPELVRHGRQWLERELGAAGEKAVPSV